jgi:hypothetical protein
MKLLERGRNTLLTCRVRDAFFAGLAEVHPDALRELDDILKRLPSSELDPDQPESLWFRYLSSDTPEEFRAPEYLHRWAARNGMRWPWVLRAAAEWLCFAARGHDQRFAELPRLSGAYRGEVARRSAAAPVRLTIKPLSIPAWNCVLVPWTDYRNWARREFPKLLREYGRQAKAEAKAQGYAFRSEKHRDRLGLHMRWFIQWHVCRRTVQEILADSEAGVAEDRSVRREIARLGERLGVPPRSRLTRAARRRRCR